MNDIKIYGQWKTRPIDSTVPHVVDNINDR